MEIAGDGCNWLETVGDGWRWLEMVGDGWAWLGMILSVLELVWQWIDVARRGVACVGKGLAWFEHVRIMCNGLIWCGMACNGLNCFEMVEMV